jgi:hypothetical protein
LRNPWVLLSMTLLFSALGADRSMALNLPHRGWLLTLVGYFERLFPTRGFRSSGWGLVSASPSGCAGREIAGPAFFCVPGSGIEPGFRALR